MKIFKLLLALALFAPAYASGCLDPLNPDDGGNVIVPNVTTDGLRVLIVRETRPNRNVPPSQLSIFTSTELRAYCNQKCAKTNGQPDFRVWDESTDATRDSKDMQALFKVERKSLPWIVVANRRKGFSGPLPKTVEETIALIRRYE